MTLKSPDGDNLLDINFSRETLDVMLQHIANSAAIFKSQQIDDPEMSFNEKLKIAEKLLFENPIAFIIRFGDFMNEEHLQFLHTFKDKSNEYDLDFHIKRLTKQLNCNIRFKTIKNRRYEALKRLQEDGNFFSEEEMEKREPLLYHQLVGQYLSHKEQMMKRRDQCTDQPLLSSFLIRQAENERLQELRQRQQEEESEAMNASSEDDETPKATSSRTRWGSDWVDEENDRKIERRRREKKSEKAQLSKSEKMMLLQEFRTHMYTKFLEGGDSEFDYSSVDNNAEYDSLQIRSQDEEEKYFDDETCDDVICTDTGVEDY